MNTTKIYAIDVIDVKISQTEPPWLMVHATGRTITTGWTDAQLSRLDQTTPPRDGALILEFEARPPAADAPILNVPTVISASIELPEVHLRDFWGPNWPLGRIRVHATANFKTVEIVGVAEANRLSLEVSPRATETYVAIANNQRPLSFEQDIRLLFRLQDVRVMERLKNFNLHKYEDVKRMADRILEKLNDDMPCDGLWPAEDIAKFKKWKDDDGMPA